MRRSFYSPILRTILACGLAVAARANTLTFMLDQDGCTGHCGSGLTNFGSVTISDQGSSVLVTETLNTGLNPEPGFVRTGAGDALEFQLLGAATSISDLTDGFSVTTGTQSASVFGFFSNGIHCDICGSGTSNPYYGTLTFTVNGVTTADFVRNSNSIYFTSDIVGPTGRTGNVGALSGVETQHPLVDTGSPTPEPASVWLSLSAMFVLGAKFRPRRK